MASSKEFVDYVAGQMCGAGEISYRKMFGEYGLYCDKKFVGVICDDALYIKPTQAGRERLPEVVEAPPYAGAKPYFFIEDVEDAPLLCALVSATAAALPLPKPKKRAAKTQKAAKE